MIPAADWRPLLLAWYGKHRRDLPWRRTDDPYAIWVSEVMLQQTQVATVMPYYERWMRSFPDVESLAAASEEEVLAAWQGMGYYRRARFLRAGARWVAAHGWPRTYDDWLRVPGVGPYTAAAVGSIAFGLPTAVVDGNVERVFARVTACGESGAALLKAAQSWAASLLDAKQPGDWNQALMELGATICRPEKPKCAECPLEEVCVARQTWSVDAFPVRAAAPPVVRETHHVWVPYWQGRFGVRPVPSGGWWEGMWEFPRFVGDGAAAETVLGDLVGEGWREDLGTVRHQVTNHRITINASLVRCDRAVPGLRWEDEEGLAELPMPAPQRKVLSTARKLLGT